MGAAIITIVKLIEVSKGSCSYDCTFAVLLLVNLGKSYILLISTEKNVKIFYEKWLSSIIWLATGTRKTAVRFLDSCITCGIHRDLFDL